MQSVGRVAPSGDNLSKQLAVPTGRQHVEVTRPCATLYDASGVRSGSLESMAAVIRQSVLVGRRLVLRGRPVTGNG